jgi:stage V sporulation protein SpoVS
MLFGRGEGEVLGAATGLVDRAGSLEVTAAGAVMLTLGSVAGALAAVGRKEF